MDFTSIEVGPQKMESHYLVLDNSPIYTMVFCVLLVVKNGSIFGRHTKLHHVFFLYIQGDDSINIIVIRDLQEACFVNIKNKQINIYLLTTPTAQFKACEIFSLIFLSKLREIPPRNFLPLR